jgi:hypothetical protein
MTGDQITFISLNTAGIADTVISNKATFNNRTIATPPLGFTVNEESFQVYVNGISIPSTQRTTVQVGSNIEITFDTAAIGYVMRPEFEIVLVGKFT